MVITILSEQEYKCSQGCIIIPSETELKQSNIFVCNAHSEVMKRVK